MTVLEQLQSKVTELETTMADANTLLKDLTDYIKSHSGTNNDPALLALVDRLNTAMVAQEDAITANPVPLA